MLNRRILRIKAFKAIYTYAENPQLSVKELEAQLERSCEATRDLYLFLLAAIPAITAEAKERIEAAKGKFNPSEEEKHPNLKFTENKIAPLLAEDPDFGKLISKRKLSWDQYDVCIRHIYESIKTQEYYASYMDSGKDSLKEDAELWERIFENEFEDNPEVEEILEDMSIWWNDDLAYALNWCCRSMNDLGKGSRWDLPPLYMSDVSDKEESDKAFVVNLLRKAVTGYQGYIDKIAENTPKWDLNRICTTDLALIIAGLAEADSFANIPSKVTINEYVEISKYYSTSESRAFVNGLLDKLINKH